MAAKPIKDVAFFINFNKNRDNTICNYLCSIDCYVKEIKITEKHQHNTSFKNIKTMCKKLY